MLHLVVWCRCCWVDAFWDKVFVVNSSGMAALVWVGTCFNVGGEFVNSDVTTCLDGDAGVVGLTPL